MYEFHDTESVNVAFSVLCLRATSITRHALWIVLALLCLELYADANDDGTHRKGGKEQHVLRDSARLVFVVVHQL